MKAYISAARAWKARAASLAAELEKFGIQVSCKWWEHIGPVDDSDVAYGRAQTIADEEFNAIADAGVFILLTPETGLGCQRETGYAQACRRINGHPLVIVAGRECRTLFDTVVDGQAPDRGADLARYVLTKVLSITGHLPAPPLSSEVT